jgi:hypothetical protein
VRKVSLYTLIAGLAVSVISPAFSQVSGGSISTISQGTFNLAEAYPCAVGTYAANLGIANQQVFSGVCTSPRSATGASPGILCLRRVGSALDVSCFAIIPSGQAPPCFVQGYQLTKSVPGSFKCPDVYGIPHFDGNGNLLPYQYFQFGGGVRTWWSLNFTQPGTTFVLDVVSVCRQGTGGNAPGTPLLHKDRWTWRVVADVHTLLNVIELMHGGAVGTLEVPCIIGEDMYDALKAAQGRLSAAIDLNPNTVGDRQTQVGNAIFDMEALIVANCLFVEVLNPVVAFPGADQFGAPNIQPPGNTAQTVVFGSQGSAIAGIIDTVEHPCCCKLLVDLEWIALRQGLTGQTPTLPVF